MSKVLQYHFNPPFRQGLRLSSAERPQDGLFRRNPQVPIWLKKKNQNYYFDGLCFEPANSKEKPLGLLCLLAEINETSPEETEIIAKLVKILQREYYRFFYPNPTDCFKWALEQGNRFLNHQIKNNNIDWLSKLNFAAFAIRPNLSINLAKIGEPAALLFTNGEVFDLGQSLTPLGARPLTGLTQEAAPFKSFSNTIEGDVQSHDKILLLSQKLFETFDEEEIFRWLLSAKNQREAKNIFKQKKDILRHSFGVCLLVHAKRKNNLLLRLAARRTAKPQNKYTRLFEKKIHNKPRSFPSQLQTILLFLILATLIFLAWRAF